MMAQVKLFGRILAEFVSILSVVAMFLGFFAWFGEKDAGYLHLDWSAVTISIFARSDCFVVQ